MTSRGGLINSGFYSEIGSGGARHGLSGTYPLGRTPLRRGSWTVRPPIAPLPTHLSYVPAKSRRRARYRFAKPQVIWSQWVFFANPR